MKNHQITKPMNNSFVNQPALLTAPAMRHRSGYTPDALVCNRHKPWFQKIRWMVLVGLILLGISAKGQLYPVTLSVSGDYSFSGSIADIANGTVGNFAANIVTNDMTVSSREVFLKISIDGMGIKATTIPDGTNIEQITIGIGRPVAIDKQKLKEYFDFGNLTGISEQLFTNLLPEGTYTFTFEVFDYNNLTTAISNKVFFNVHVSHGIPPQVISPNCGSVMKTSSVPIIWTPAVAQGFTITYELEYLIDEEMILDATSYFTGLKAEAEIETGIQGNTYTFFTQNVNATIPYRVIYRVRAVTTTIVEGIEVLVIDNEGYSEICSFDYKPELTAEPCTEISSVVVDKNNSGSTFANIIWTVKSGTEVEGQKYTLSFKPVAMPGISPFEIPNITATNCKVNDLLPGLKYKFTVTAECNSVLSEMFVEYTMPMAVSPITNCGEKAPFDPVNASNLLGKDKLGEGNYIYIKGVPIVIETVPADILALINKPTKIYSELPTWNSDGSFTGYGRITFAIPLFQEYTPGVAVIFKNLFIDKDYNVIAGYVETIYDPGNWEKHIANMNIFDKGGKLFEKIMTDGFKPNMTLKGVIGDTANIVVDKTKSPFEVTIKYTTPTSSGKTQEEPFALPSSGGTGDVPIEVEGTPYHYFVVEDAEKTYYGIDLTTGAVICIGRYNPDINDILADIKPDVIDIKPSITFENGPEPVFAFDPANPVYNSNMLFQKPYVLSGSPDYPLRWKFLTTGSGIDKVVAKMPADIVQNKETLKFVVTSNNTEIDYTPGAAGSDIVLNLMPATSDAVYSVHAVVNAGTKEVPNWQQAGRFDVFTRTAKNYSVTLVPMGGSVPSKTDVKTALDAIWSRYGITWTVDVDGEFYKAERLTTINSIIDIYDTHKIEAGDKWPTEYSDQQLDINRAYRDYVVAAEKYSKEEMYVFVLPTSAAPEVGQLGDMPLGKQWGYLFGTTDSRTLAHELGHGKTKLDHTFKGGQIDERTTNNLMDYTSSAFPNGTDLVRCQWEYIHDPAMFDPGQTNADGAMGDSKLLALLNSVGADACIFLKKCSEPFKITDRYSIPTYLNGIRYKAVVGKYSSISGITIKEGNSSLENLKSTYSNITLDPNVEQYVIIGQGGMALPCNTETDYGNFCNETDVSNDEIFIQKWATDIANCILGKRPVRNIKYFTNTFDPVEELSSDKLLLLDKLLGGESAITENGTKYHTSKTTLVYTNEHSSAKQLEDAQSFVPESGVTKIWIHKGPLMYELRSNIPDFVISTLEISAETARQKIIETILNEFNSTRESFEEVATSLYEFFDATSKRIRLARIPEYVWNPESDGYKKGIFIAYQFYISPVRSEGEKYKSLTIEELKYEIGESFPEMKEALERLSEPEVEFAFYCGLWNGLIEIVASVSDIGALTTGAFSPEGRTKIQEVFNLVNTFLGKDGSSGFWAAMKIGFTKTYNDPYKLGELGGEITVIVATSAINPESVVSISAPLANVTKGLKFYDRFATELNPLGYTLKFAPEGMGELTNRVGNELAQIAESKLIAKTINEGSFIDLPASTLDNISLQQPGDKLLAITGSKSYPIVEFGLVLKYELLTTGLKDLILNFGLSSLKLAENGTDIIILATNGIDEVGRIVNNKLIPKRFISTGTAVGNPVDNLQVVKNGNEYGFRIADPTVTKLGINFTDFKASVVGGFPNPDIADESFFLYGEEKWDELELLFKNNNLNRKWPPADGGYNIVKVQTIKPGKYDRYQKTLITDEQNITEAFEPTFTGSFTSPLDDVKLPYEKRALEGPENSYDLYYEIEVLEELPFTGDLADIIPWHGYEGKGKQMKFNFPKEWDLETWSRLQRDNKIKITIKSSPSGKYDILPDGKIKLK